MPFNAEMKKMHVLRTMPLQRRVNCRIFLERYTNGAVICTDSKAALQSLSKNLAENLEIVAKIKRSVRVLTNQGRVVKFLWILSHVGICGNERADVLAAEGDHIEYFIPKTLLQLRGSVRQHHRDNYSKK
ncbi:uncharacterized protein [Procambarus clarkii]|uniref:uncharacterized protein n=1 Tax=Procambarus clarkii TaxID=6728 RepID=UPI0037447AC9